MFRLRYPWACPPLFSARNLTAYAPFFKALGGLYVTTVALFLVARPLWLEKSLPGWQSSLGLTALFIAVWGFAASLPPRIRAYLVPGYWLLVVAVLATQVTVSSPVRGSATTRTPSLEADVKF